MSLLTQSAAQRSIHPAADSANQGVAIRNNRPRILVVDDEPAMRQLLSEVLEPHAVLVATASDAHQAIQMIEERAFDLVLSDMYMPGLDGLEFLALARHAGWDVAFVLITGRPEIDPLISALRLEASDFLLKPVSINVLLETIERSFQRLQLLRAARAYRDQLEASIQERTRDLASALKRLEENFESTLEALVAALDAREHETYSHSFRVRAYTVHLAGLIGYPKEIYPQLEHAALLHDIGKIAVSDAILLKPGKLDPHEWQEMRRHPVVGEGILNRVGFLRPAALIVRNHHERYDGTGYPDGLTAERIPLGARLFAAADTFDAMTSDRPYRRTPGIAAACAEILRCSGSQFDPEIVEAFLSVPEKTWTDLRTRVDQRHSPTVLD